MANQNTTQRLGLTPGKTALIGVLAVVLLGVLYMQFGGGGGDAERPAYKPPGAAIRSVPRSAAVAVSEEKKTSEESEAVLTAFDPSRWEAPELTTVIAYDPFARPAAFPQPQLLASGEVADIAAADEATAAERAKELADALVELQRKLEELQQRGVHVIVRSGDEYVAVIGERTVHVGEDLEGFTVTAIEPDGVHIERKGIE